jgi:hypothetical protein
LRMASSNSARSAMASQRSPMAPVICSGLGIR